MRCARLAVGVVRDALPAVSDNKPGRVRRTGCRQQRGESRAAPHCGARDVAGTPLAISRSRSAKHPFSCRSKGSKSWPRARPVMQRPPTRRRAIRRARRRTVRKDRLYASQRRPRRRRSSASAACSAPSRAHRRRASTSTAPKNSKPTRSSAWPPSRRRPSALAEAMPHNPLKPAEHGLRSGPRAAGRHAAAAERRPRHEQHGHRGHRLRKARRRHPAHRLQRGQRAARPRARRFRRAGADDQPGRARRRQPELAEGRAARADAARGLHPAREDHALRPRAHPRAHRACARLGGARLLRVLRGARPN